jgi:hypothetical protein
MGDGLALEVVGFDLRENRDRRFGSGGGRLDHLHFSQESVASSRHAFDVARFLGRFPQGIAQPSHGVVDTRVEFDHGLVGPKLVADLPANYDLARMFEQQQQNPEGLLTQKKTDTLLAQFSGANVEFEGPETE